MKILKKTFRIIFILAAINMVSCSEPDGAQYPYDLAGTDGYANETSFFFENVHVDERNISFMIPTFMHEIFDNDGVIGNFREVSSQSLSAVPSLNEVIYLRNLYITMVQLIIVSKSYSTN